MSKSKALENHSAFTLVELLIVIAVIAILSVVVIMAINPVEMLRKARDSNRSSDLNVLNKALSIYNTDQPSGSLGSATIVYVSLPDSSGTCANLGLPTLPTGYTYACATTANLRKTDGTGWVPVNLASISFGTPLATLPIDPVNTIASGLYYTYIPGGSWELDAMLEASKYRLKGSGDKTSTDGGDNLGIYEVGSNLTLSPNGYGNFNNWTLANGATVNQDGELVLTASNQVAWSPYIPINERVWTIAADFYTDVQSPYVPFQPNGGMLWSSDYFNSSYVATLSSAGYTGNGNAQQVSLSVWTHKTWYESGTFRGIQYLRINIAASSHASLPQRVRDFNVSVE